MVAESLAAVSAVVSQIQTIKDALSAAIEARDSVVFEKKAVELNAQIIAAQELALSAQAAQAALVDRERALKEKIADLEAWERTKARYEFQEVRDGCFAYALKEGVEPPEQPHKICVNCYEDRRKSVLQRQKKEIGRRTLLVCHGCRAEVVISG